MQNHHPYHLVCAASFFHRAIAIFHPAKHGPLDHGSPNAPAPCHEWIEWPFSIWPNMVPWTSWTIVPPIPQINRPQICQTKSAQSAQLIITAAMTPGHPGHIKGLTTMIGPSTCSTSAKRWKPRNPTMTIHGHHWLSTQLCIDIHRLSTSLLSIVAVNCMDWPHHGNPGHCISFALAWFPSVWFQLWLFNQHLRAKVHWTRTGLQVIFERDWPYLCMELWCHLWKDHTSRSRFPAQGGLKTPHICEFPNKATTGLCVCHQLWWHDTMFGHGGTGQKPIMGHPGHIAQPPNTPNHIGLTGRKCHIAPEIAVRFAQFPHFLICEDLGQKDWPNGEDTPIYEIHGIHAIISIMIGHDQMKWVWWAGLPLEHNKLRITCIIWFGISGLKIQEILNRTFWTLIRSTCDTCVCVCALTAPNLISKGCTHTENLGCSGHTENWRCYADPS